jgi:hypothetical protein
MAFVGAAAGCDLLILLVILDNLKPGQKIAAFGSSYRDPVSM